MILTKIDAAVYKETLHDLFNNSDGSLRANQRLNLRFRENCSIDEWRGALLMINSRKYWKQTHGRS